jgi:hypothetical protein
MFSDWWPLGAQRKKALDPLKHFFQKIKIRALTSPTLIVFLSAA